MTSIGSSTPYIQLPSASGENFRRLVAWQRVPLNPGESKQVTLTVDRLYVSVFDTEADDWKVLPGDYIVSAGSSSRDLPLTTKVTVE